MKTLSVRQPWAWLIVTGRKDIENRSWPTRFRCEVAIHAGIKFEDDDYELMVEDGRIPEDMTPAKFARGGIVGATTITDCVTRSSSDWFNGPYGFVLANSRELPFRPYRGKLGFFDLPCFRCGGTATRYIDGVECCISCSTIGD